MGWWGSKARTDVPNACDQVLYDGIKSCRKPLHALQLQPCSTYPARISHASCAQSNSEAPLYTSLCREGMQVSSKNKANAAEDTSA
jgi:hypothetical protein